IFHLQAVDVFTTGNDHVLDSVGDKHITGLIHPAPIAGVHPAVTYGLGGGFRLVPVAQHHMWATRDDFPHLTTRQLVVILIDNAHFRGDHGAAVGTMATALATFFTMHFGSQHGSHRRQLR